MIHTLFIGAVLSLTSELKVMAHRGQAMTLLSE